MRALRLPSLLLACALLHAQDVSKLPDWAAQAAREAEVEMAPADVEAWVLLDRTEIAYTGDGEIRQRRFRLAKVLTEQGTGQGVFVLRGLGGRASKVKKLKGWNLRSDGELVKLDADHVVTQNDAGDAEFSTATLTGAVLSRVAKGSYVAFESLEVIQSPLGPVASAYPMERLPVRRWELDVAKQEGWFSNLKAVDVKVESLHFKPWIEQVETLGTTGFRLRQVPGLPQGESGHPFLGDILPVVRVRFLDPAWPQARMWGHWDEVARWTHGQYLAPASPAPAQGLGSGKGLDGLQGLWGWMGRSLTYKQVYLTPERGWVPESPGEVGRKRYGDCKDLASFFMAEARRMGFSAHPVLARIVEGSIEPAAEVYPEFNHVIAAVRLDQSLGLPAEVQTDQGRYLLVDPTDPLTPFGRLASAHLGRRVMICLPMGAQWVRIPDTAIMPDAMDVHLKGEVHGTQVEATLTLKETGDYWALRPLVHRAGVKGLRERLLSSYFDLPAHATLEVVRTGDPLDLSRPFEVELRIIQPEGLRRSGEEWTLPAWGLPYLPGIIQKAGQPRRYPVVRSDYGRLAFHAEYSLPERLHPLLPVKEARTPFRSLSWKAETQPSAQGCLLRLDLIQTLTPVRFEFLERDKGVVAWKQDRALVKTLLEDGLAVTRAQGTGTPGS